MTNGLWSEGDSRILDFTGLNFTTAPTVRANQWQNWHSDPKESWQKEVRRRTREKNNKYKVNWGRVAFQVMVFSTGGLICDEFDAFLRKVGTIISTRKNKRGMVKKLRQKVHWLIVNNVHSTLRESGKIYR